MCFIKRNIRFVGTHQIFRCFNNRAVELNDRRKNSSFLVANVRGNPSKLAVQPDTDEFILRPFCFNQFTEVSVANVSSFQLKNVELLLKQIS